jgi:hypothetical protein
MEEIKFSDNDVEKHVKDLMDDDFVPELTYLTDAECRFNVTKLPKVDESAYPGMTFVVCTYGERLNFLKHAGTSFTLNDPRNQKFVFQDMDYPKAAIDFAKSNSKKSLIVYIHDDVYLPKTWGPRFWNAYTEASKRGIIGVAGVFGVNGSRDSSSRTEHGELVDLQGKRLLSRPPLPWQVRALDECVLAFPRTSPISPDPLLKWHLYGADLCLQASEQGTAAVTLHAPIYHASNTVEPPKAFWDSAAVFRSKWAKKLPIEVPCAIIK